MKKQRARKKRNASSAKRATRRANLIAARPCCAASFCQAGDSLYQGRSGAAFGIGGAFFASAVGMNYFDRIYDSRRQDYETSANQFFLTSPLFLSSAGFSISSPLQLAPLGFGIAQNTSAARVRMENAARWSNNFRTLVVGLYVWNLADVLLFHPAPDQEVGVSVGPGGAGMRFSFHF